MHDHEKTQAANVLLLLPDVRFNSHLIIITLRAGIKTSKLLLAHIIYIRDSHKTQNIFTRP